MNSIRFFRSLLVFSGLSLAAAVGVRAAEVEPGYVDFGQLMPSAKGQFVEVNLSSGLLRFAAKIAARQEPEAAELIANLKRIRVNVVGLDDSNRTGTVERMESIRRKLETEGWTQMKGFR